MENVEGRGGFSQDLAGEGVASEPRPSRAKGSSLRADAPSSAEAVVVPPKKRAKPKLSPAELRSRREQYARMGWVLADFSDRSGLTQPQPPKEPKS